jgi:hypothetical protein
VRYIGIDAPEMDLIGQALTHAQGMLNWWKEDHHAGAGCLSLIPMTGCCVTSSVMFSYHELVNGGFARHRYWP